MESFINNGIKDWKVTDWGFVDFNNFTPQEFGNIVSINDQIMDMLAGRIKMDVGVIKEHHRIIGDKKIKNLGQEPLLLMSVISHYRKAFHI